MTSLAHLQEGMVLEGMRRMVLDDGEVENTKDGPASVRSERDMKWMPSRLRVASDSVIQIDHGDSGVSRSPVIERLLASSKVGALAGSWCCTRLSILRAEKHGYQ